MKRINANQTDSGKLRVWCASNGRARPVAGAKISVFRADADGSEKQIEELETDASGRAPDITLPAPSDMKLNPHIRLWCPCELPSLGYLI